MRYHQGDRTILGISGCMLVEMNPVVTVLVSGAAGSVGNLVGQFAKLAGCRVVMCGFISIYNDFSNIPPMTNWLAVAGNRATMTGFNVTYHKDKFKHALSRIGRLIDEDKLVLAHDVLDGFEQLPKALERIYAGLNIGKQLVRVE